MPLANSRDHQPIKSDIDRLRSAGFSEEEIGLHYNGEREKLRAAGFSDSEIDANIAGTPNIPSEPSAGLIRRVVDNVSDVAGEVAPHRMLGTIKNLIRGEMLSRPTGEEQQSDPVGRVPKSTDFIAAAKVLANSDTPAKYVVDKLIKLYNTEGVLPAEVAHDATKDPVFLQNILSSDLSNLHYNSYTRPPPVGWHSPQAEENSAISVAKDLAGGVYQQEFSKGFASGAKNMVSSGLKGSGVLISSAERRGLEATLKQLDAVDRGEKIRLADDIMGVGSMNPEQRADFRKQLEAKLIEPHDVTDNVLYKTGDVIEKFGSSILTPRKGWEDSWIAGIGSGFGSVGAAIVMNTISPVAAGLMFVTAGSGEAVEKAVKNGATNEQIARAAQFGTIAGATDVVDVLLPSFGGSPGKLAGYMSKFGWSAVKGVLAEGGQEGFQEWMQNLIAKKIYKPDQDVWEGVPKAAIIGAIVGGGVTVISSAVNEITSQSPPEQAYPVDEWLKIFNQNEKIDNATKREIETTLTGQSKKELTGTQVQELFAYHGTAADFEAFDIGKVGTGQGAQSYGHGIYVAENPEVAKEYQKDLSRQRYFGIIDGKKVGEAFDNPYNDISAEAAFSISKLNDLRPGEEIVVTQEMANRAYRKRIDDLGNNEERLNLFEAINSLVGKRVGWNWGTHGNLYAVRITADKSAMLDWDKPLSEQSPQVQEVLNSLMDRWKSSITTDPTGEQIYNNLAASTEGYKQKQEAMRILREAGIPGIHYLDRGSRAEGKGTSNYVIFDDANIKITHKNGQPLTPVEREDITHSQRNEIAKDAEGKMLAAGVNAEQAKATAAVIAARYVARASRLSGKSPVELYKAANIQFRRGTQSDVVATEGTFNQAGVVRPEETKGHPAGELEDTAWRSIEPNRTKEGKIKGAPQWVTDTVKLMEMRKLIHQLVQEGKRGRFWYEQSAQSILDLTGGDVAQAEKIIGLLAIYSPQTAVFTNLTFAVRAYQQFLRGEQVDVKTGEQDAKAQAWLKDGKDWGGRKVNNFYINLMHELVADLSQEEITKLKIPNDVMANIKGATVDLWVFRALGYNVDAAGSERGVTAGGLKTSADSKYGFAENELRRVAGELNQDLAPGEQRWLPHQVQAALWSAIKARHELPEVKTAATAESIARGYTKMVPHKKTGKLVPKFPSQGQPGRSEHMAIWREHALKATPEAVAGIMSEASGSFGTAIDRTIQNITSETIPSATLNHPINKATPEQKRAFHREAAALTIDERGRDVVADKIGAFLNITKEGSGVFEGNISPNTITKILLEKPSGYFDATTAKLVAKARQFIYRQDAVPFFRADAKASFAGDFSVTDAAGKTIRTFDSQADAFAFVDSLKVTDKGQIVDAEGKTIRKVKNKAEGEALLKTLALKGGTYAHGYKVVFHEALTAASEEQLLANLQKHLGPDAGWSRVGPGEYAIINFRGDNGIPFMADADFHAKIAAYLAEAGEKIDAERSGAFGSEGEYNGHDWTKDPAGVGLTDAFAGRPDLQAWLRDRAAAFDKLLKRWQDPAAVKTERLELQQDVRGQISIDRNKALITLFEKADASTLVHEPAHLWLEEMRADAALPDAPAQIKADMQTLLDWFGVESVDDITRSHHEQFSEAFEQYMAEGKAPSSALKTVFENFKKWLINIYNSLTDAGITVSEDVKAVMDRMIATDEEIGTTPTPGKQAKAGTPSTPQTYSQRTWKYRGGTNQPMTAQEKIRSQLSVGAKDANSRITIDNLYTQAFDDLHPVAKIDRWTYVLARLTRGQFGKAQQFLENSTFDFNTYRNIGPGLREILKPHRQNLDGLRIYLAAAHAIEIEALGYESGMDLQAAAQTVREGAAQYERTAQQIYEYQNHLLSYLKDSGVVSQAAYDVMRSKYARYVPFYTLMTEFKGSDQLGKDFGPGSPIKKLKGSTRARIDPLESIVKNTYAYISIAERNTVGLSLIDALKAQQAQDPGLIGPVGPLAKDAAWVRAEEFLRDSGIETPSDELVMLMRDLSTKEDGSTIAAYRDGKREAIRVNDPDLVQAYHAMDKETAGMLVKILAMPARWLRAGATITPDFIFRNVMRDYLSAIVFSTGGGIFNPIDTVKGAIGYLREDTDYQNWLKGGGAHATWVSMDRQYLQESLQKLTEDTGLMSRSFNVITNPFLGMRMLSELFENATRLGEFKKAMRQRGVETKENIQAASYSSREVTLDFARIGASMRAYNMITAFANARLQGPDRFVRAVIDHPIRTLSLTLLANTLPSVLLWFANKDDDRYKNLPQWQKDFFWIILTENHIWRIPKNFEVGVIFGSGAERLLEKFYANNPRAFDKFFGSLTSALAPAYMITLGQPLIEQFANRSMFSDRDLIPQFMEKELPEVQYTPYTTELAKFLGKHIAAVPMIREWSLGNGLTGPPARAVTSPILIENYIRAWTGGTGQYLLQATDLALRKVGMLPDPPKPEATLADMPFIKAFAVRYPSASVQPIQDFHDGYLKQKAYLASWERFKKEADLQGMKHIQDIAGKGLFQSKTLDGINEVLKINSQMIRNIERSPSISPKEKRQLIDGLYLKMIDTAIYGRTLMEQGKKVNATP